MSVAAIITVDPDILVASVLGEPVCQLWVLVFRQIISAVATTTPSAEQLAPQTQLAVAPTAVLQVRYATAPHLTRPAQKIAPQVRLSVVISAVRQDRRVILQHLLADYLLMQKKLNALKT